REPRRGVSSARNRAVAAARGWADFIAFIDDDEVPEPVWLDELLRVQSEYDADVVAGPVLQRFEGEVPSWVRRGRFFETRRHPTGFPREDPGAGNVLIRTAVLAGMDEPFDERFSLTGGEDTHLFLRLAWSGRRMVWADEALAYEWTPPTRTRARWILRRVYRSANTWSACERELRPSLRVGAVRVAKGVVRIAYGLALLPFSWLLGRHMVVRSLWYVCFGAGNLTGLTGLRYHEYRTVHGR
ncbi:MAG TPA: glycosyltransferase family 2 protein, partial [Longimicrobiaceae bacterium]|nr:glycosyltransferase family 2 protein [Longimicrobiaceae bacterium]